MGSSVEWRDREAASTGFAEIASIGDYEATLKPLFQTTRRLRITRVPMCIPNKYLTSLLVQRKVKVFSMELEVNNEDGLISNTRTAVVSTDDWENVPDRLSWELKL